MRQQSSLINGKREWKNSTVVELRHFLDVVDKLQMEENFLNKCSIWSQQIEPDKLWRVSPKTGKCNRRNAGCWCWCGSGRDRPACKRWTSRLANRNIPLSANYAIEDKIIIGESSSPDFKGFDSFVKIPPLVSAAPNSPFIFVFLIIWQFSPKTTFMWNGMSDALSLSRLRVKFSAASLIFPLTMTTCPNSSGELNDPMNLTMFLSELAGGWRKTELATSRSANFDKTRYQQCLQGSNCYETKT